MKIKTNFHDHECGSKVGFCRDTSREHPLDEPRCIVIHISHTYVHLEQGVVPGIEVVDWRWLVEAVVRGLHDEGVVLPFFAVQHFGRIQLVSEDVELEASQVVAS